MLQNLHATLANALNLLPSTLHWRAHKPPGSNQHTFNNTPTPTHPLYKRPSTCSCQLNAPSHCHTLFSHLQTHFSSARTLAVPPPSTHNLLSHTPTKTARQSSRTAAASFHMFFCHFCHLWQPAFEISHTSYKHTHYHSHQYTKRNTGKAAGLLEPWADICWHPGSRQLPSRVLQGARNTQGQCVCLLCV